MFGILLDGGGLLGAVLAGLPGMHGFATVADVPAGCPEVPVVDVPVVDDAPDADAV